jgi:hypothetical protein
VRHFAPFGVAFWLAFRASWDNMRLHQRDHKVYRKTVKP